MTHAPDDLLKPHFDAILRAYCVDDPAHQPEPRGVMALAEALECSVTRLSERGGKFSLFVVRASDLPAASGLHKIAIAAKAMRDREKAKGGQP